MAKQHNSRSQPATSTSPDICPICDSTEFIYRFTVNDLRLEGCTNCGLVRQKVVAFAADNDSNIHAGIDPTVEREAAQIYVQRLKRHTNGQAILLVGRSREFFFEAAIEHGCRVVHQLDVRDLETASLPSHSYDAIVIVDSFEQTTNPVAVLEDLQNALTPDGVLLLISLSADSWSARFFQQNWSGWHPKNKFYFDQQVLQSMLIRGGFEQIQLYPERRRYSLKHIYGRVSLAPTQNFMTRMIRFGYWFTPQWLRKSPRIRVTTSRIIVTARPKQQRPRPLLSIVMPVYNEQATIEKTLTTVLNKQIPGVDKEVIVVESNSTDGSREIVRSYADHPEVKIVLEDRPRGKGKAVRVGFSHAQGDFVLIQDADQEYDVNDYDILVSPLMNFRSAFVLGSRHTSSWKMREFNDQPGLSTYFNIGHFIFCTALNLLYGQHLKDPFTMYKVFRRDCLHGLEFECNRFDFDFELVIKLVRKGYTPLEVPVNYHARSMSEGKKVTVLRDPLTWMVALAKFRFSPLYAQEQEPGN